MPRLAFRELPESIFGRPEATWLPKRCFPGILAFRVWKPHFLKENKGPEGSSGAFRRYFSATWEQTWLLECKVDVKISQVESKMGQDKVQRSQEAGQKGEVAWQKGRQLEAKMLQEGSRSGQGGHQKAS